MRIEAKAVVALMSTKFRRALPVVLAVLALTSCGGGDDSSCPFSAPSPRINSYPPTVATAGYLYGYGVGAAYTCWFIPFFVTMTCGDIVWVQLPAGASAGWTGFSWTPQSNQANTDVPFVIATYPDICGQQAWQSWSVHVYAPPVLETPPVIESFIATRETIDAGESVMLTAVFQDSGRIEDLGPVMSGVPIATPALNTSTSFTLIVTNGSGAEARRRLIINVLAPPAIQSLFASPPLVALGDRSTLKWTATGHFTVARLDPLGADVRGVSSFVVTPATTTTYVLHLSNAVGASARATVQVEVVPPPVIESFAATPSSSALRGTVLLTARFHGTGHIEAEVSGRYTWLGPVVSELPASSGDLLRSTRFRLVVRNAFGTEITQDLLVPITGPGTFQPTRGQPIHPGRFRHTATRLADGRVFIAGGLSDLSTEVFDPETETFTVGPTLIEGRQMHSAVLLRDGRVLLIGGNFGGTGNFEIYDPSTGSITAASWLPLYYGGDGSARELPDGRVLEVQLGGGGILIDPLTETFKWTPPSSGNHACTRAERLADGRVLLIDPSSMRLSEVFSPGSDSFAATDAVTNSRGCGFVTAALRDGRVLIAGGDVSPSVRAEIYDPLTGLFAEVGSQQHFTTRATASTLTGGTVLVVGGDRWQGVGPSPWAELFDPATGTFTATGGLRMGRWSHTATVLQDGRVLVVGGGEAELYTPR
jgi:hypothetical protein